MPWKPGQSGNPAGRPKSKPITAALKALLDKDDGQAIKAIAAVGLKHALKGDFRYFKELIDRSDGKVVEQIEMSGGMDISQFPGLTAKQLAAVAELEDAPGEEE